MPSGKQIFTKILKENSIFETNDIQKLSDLYKAGFLLHASHSPSNIETISEFGYLKEEFVDPSGNSNFRQGVGSLQLSTLLSDFMFDLSEITDIPENIKNKYPSLTYDHMQMLLHVIAVTLSAFDWDSTLSELEQEWNDDQVSKMLQWSEKQFKNQ